MSGIRDQDDLDLTEKFKAYEEQYARYLLSKYFSNKAMYGAKVFEEVKIDDEVIKASRFPCMESYADPLQTFLAKDIVSGSGTEPVQVFLDKGKAVADSDTELQPDHLVQDYLNKGKGKGVQGSSETNPVQVFLDKDKASGSGTVPDPVQPLELDFFKTLDLNSEPVGEKEEDGEPEACLKLDCSKIPDDDSDTDPVEINPQNNNQMDTDQSGIYPDDRAHEDVELGSYAETVEALLELSRGAPNPSGTPLDLSNKKAKSSDPKWD
ncbi:hypothetical protein K2173_020143 [Erythroxylum novogranatense]|uniref:Uncharacterized protein n=1 Tax=Erythroxylum novogranatense TaxID=1862640 RepID=A0AAV8UAL7_9ROSI|nr:hypothetical protein K2173_020143 [Erythroxylum novogranatense]